MTRGAHKVVAAVALATAATLVPAAAARAADGPPVKHAEPGAPNGAPGEKKKAAAKKAAPTKKPPGVKKAPAKKAPAKKKFV